MPSARLLRRPVLLCAELPTFPFPLSWILCDHPAGSFGGRRDGLHLSCPVEAETLHLRLSGMQAWVLGQGDRLKACPRLRLSKAKKPAWQEKAAHVMQKDVSPEGKLCAHPFSLSSASSEKHWGDPTLAQRHHSAETSLKIWAEFVKL